MHLSRQITSAKRIDKVLRFFGKLLVRRERRVAWLADLIEAQQAILKTLLYVAKREGDIRAMERRIREFEAIADDPRVAPILDAFPGAEITNVAHMEVIDP